VTRGPPSRCASQARATTRTQGAGPEALTRGTGVPPRRGLRPRLLAPRYPPGASPTRPACASAVGDPTQAGQLFLEEPVRPCASMALAHRHTPGWSRIGLPLSRSSRACVRLAIRRSCAHAAATRLTGRESRHQAGRVSRSSGRVAAILRLRSVSRRHYRSVSATTLEPHVCGVSRAGLSPFLHTRSCTSSLRVIPLAQKTT